MLSWRGLLLPEAHIWKYLREQMLGILLLNSSLILGRVHHWRYKYWRQLLVVSTPRWWWNLMGLVFHSLLNYKPLNFCCVWKMEAPKIIKMVTALGPWNPEWRRAHGYKNGESSRSFHRVCSEFPDLIKLEISFLKNQYWRTETIFFLTAMYNIKQHEDMENMDVWQRYS